VKVDADTGDEVANEDIVKGLEGIDHECGPFVIASSRVQVRLWCVRYVGILPF
jgi:hypothetical protein